MIPIDIIHHMPKYWPDPYKFDPERYNYIAEFLSIMTGLHQKQRLVDHSWLTCHLAGVHATVLG